MNVNVERLNEELKPVKLLVVDDREDNLLSVETILEQDGYQIVKANSGRAALKILLKEHDFTLILMDVQMPGLSGFETATMIYERERLRQIPIIFITANDYGDEHIFKGYQMGGVDYIYKPINPGLLRAKVSVFVELYQKTNQLIAQEQKLIHANKRLEQEVRDRIQSEQQVNLLNKQLIENIRQLRSTNEELERFAYVASHDLQEPLRKIILFADRLSISYKDILKAEGLDFLNRIISASERMQQLIKNILAFSGSTHTEEHFEVVDPGQLIEEVLSDLEIFMEQKKARIELAPLPAIQVIPSQFRQLIQNILINALKFSREEEPPMIRIRSTMLTGSGIEDIPPGRQQDEFCLIEIEDNGIGFDPAYADQIFMMFKRLHSYNRFDGTGIGLAICKKIVDKHQGTISAASVLQQGSVFRIALPLRQAGKQPATVFQDGEGTIFDS